MLCIEYACVAQLEEALDLGSRCWGFESLHRHHVCICSPTGRGRSLRGCVLKVQILPDAPNFSGPIDYDWLGRQILNLKEAGSTPPRAANTNNRELSLTIIHHKHIKEGITHGYQEYGSKQTGLICALSKQ